MTDLQPVADDLWASIEEVSEEQSQE